MELYRTYIKLILLKNKLKYLLIILSIIVSFLAISIITFYIDNILTLNTYLPMQNLSYIFDSFQTLFCIGGITFIIYQYYNTMKSSTSDYSILKALGASGFQIRMMVVIQALTLIILTIPSGILLGDIITRSIIEALMDFTAYNQVISSFNSSMFFILLSILIAIAILIIGFVLEKGIRNMPPTQIYPENAAFGKEA